MRCPKCGSRDDKVIDSRQSRDSSSIRRRRQCLSCGYRFTTYEEIERSDLRVIKRDRRTHEQFDRRKLAGSIAKAFEKRSTSLLTLEQLVDDIVHELETSGREVNSSDIGAKVLEKLKDIDEVAYLRYASVHQRFGDVDEFVDAIQKLGRRVKKNSAQRELFAVDETQEPRLNSIVIGCTRQSPAPRTRPAIRAGGLPITSPKASPSICDCEPTKASSPSANSPRRCSMFCA